MMEPYAVFLHLEVAETLSSVRPRDRDKILQFIHSLSRDPFQAGDFRGHDSRGRANEVKLVDILAVIFYVNHADREVRILEVRRSDSF